MNILNILLPLYLIIGLGFLFKKRQFPSLDFWDGVEKLVYFILFPALIFSNLARAEINHSLIWQVLWGIAIPTFIIGASQWLGLLIPGIKRDTFSSMYQGAVRNNTTIGLVIAGMVLPGHGVAIMALIMTIMVIINNISCVMVLTHYGDVAQRSHSFGEQSMLVKILSNPLIIACVAGLAFSMAHISLPDPVHEAIYFLGQTGLPLALLAVGAGLKLTRMAGKTVAVLISTVAKLIITPILIYIFVRMSHLELQNAQIFVFYGGLPTAMSSYVLASQLGGDKETMAQIITLQTLVAALSLPILLMVMKNMV